MDIIQAIYIAAGLALPLYYIPQTLRCLQDETLLSSYSLAKSVTQLTLRFLMMPFVLSVGNTTMSVIVALDLAGRLLEASCAVRSLRRQGQTWREITGRARSDSARAAPLTVFGTFHNTESRQRSD